MVDTADNMATYDLAGDDTLLTMVLLTMDFKLMI